MEKEKGKRCAQKKQRTVTKLFFQACKRRDIQEIDQQYTSNYERNFYT
jgi:hypothetical protein